MLRNKRNTTALGKPKVIDLSLTVSGSPQRGFKPPRRIQNRQYTNAARRAWCFTMNDPVGHGWADHTAFIKDMEGECGDRLRYVTMLQLLL